MTFEMWSFGHYLFMISPFIFTLLFYFVMKNKTYETKRKFGVWLSIIMIIILLLRNVEIWVKHDYAFDFELVPLQICHFANFVLLYAFMKDSKSAFAFALLFNLPAAFLSIVFANSLSHYSTILTFRGFAYIFGHLLIVSTTLWAFLEKFVILDFKRYFNTLKMILSLFLISILANNLFNIAFGEMSNYFYAMKPEEGTPLALFYQWGEVDYLFNVIEVNPTYIILTALLGLIVVSIFFATFKGFEKILFRESIHKVSMNVTAESNN